MIRYFSFLIEEDAGTSGMTYAARSKQNYEAAVDSLKCPSGFENLDPKFGREQYVTCFSGFYGRTYTLYISLQPLLDSHPRKTEPTPLGFYSQSLLGEG